MKTLTLIITFLWLTNPGLFAQSGITIQSGGAVTVNGNLTIIPAVFICGNSITINHMAGAVAPVSKTVTYGTVTNIPGETTKCWITSNLGANNQATAKDDVTEASAGWYWQFNRKQGFRHDGTTRIPNTTWISSINENSDWTVGNDPCSLEFGSGWRIPTATELDNVKISGGWIEWNGPWNSGLKFHTAGYLNTSDGYLFYRGAYGYYWSSTQLNVPSGSSLAFSSWNNYIYYGPKAYGFSMRCLRD